MPKRSETSVWDRLVAPERVALELAVFELEALDSARPELLVWLEVKPDVVVAVVAVMAVERARPLA